MNDHIVVTERNSRSRYSTRKFKFRYFYEDDDVAIVYKPKGMVVHPSAGHYTG